MKIALVGQWEQATAGYPVVLKQLLKWGNKLGYQIDPVNHGEKPLGYDYSLHVMPFMFQPVLLPDCKNIIYTMNESSRYHSKAKRFLPQYDQVIVPSPFNERSLAADGIAADVAPLGIDLEDWTLSPPRKPASECYKVLCVAHHSRKAAPTFVQAFHIAFNGDPSTQGILKSKMWTKAPNITLINANTSFEEHKRLIQDADLCVLPSLGEGFSLLPLEFLSQGKPVIISDNSSHSDFDDRMFLKLRKQRAIPAELYGKFYSGDFYESDPFELADMMKNIRQLHCEGRLTNSIIGAQSLLLDYDAKYTTEGIIQTMVK